MWECYFNLTNTNGSAEIQPGKGKVVVDVKKNKTKTTKNSVQILELTQVEREKSVTVEFVFEIFFPN